MDVNMSQGFIFGSWNAGSNTADYTQLIRNRANASDEKPNFSEITSSDNSDDKSMINSIHAVRNKLLAETAKDLTRAADVYALQEVIGDDRADIQVFKDKGFEIIRPSKNNPLYASETDTAIAINPFKFKNIENRSFTDFAVAVAKEKATGRKIAFISGHIPGFNLEEDQESIKEQASIGDAHIINMIAKLKDICADCDSVMIGADMNASPKIYKKRFQLLTKAGFKLHRTHLPTNNMSRNFQGQTPVLQERELDYIFVKKSNRFFDFFRKLFNKQKVYIAKLVADRTLLSLDPISSPSDHIPLFVRVEEVKKNFRSLFWMPS
jgi:endonuclease/exonuclease/phosphatase family metal-dependent hydrolase